MNCSMMLYIDPDLLLIYPTDSESQQRAGSNKITATIGLVVHAAGEFSSSCQDLKGYPNLKVSDNIKRSLVVY